jgi:hypothetical protein
MKGIRFIFLVAHLEKVIKMDTFAQQEHLHNALISLSLYEIKSTTGAKLVLQRRKSNAMLGRLVVSVAYYCVNYDYYVVNICEAM